MYDIYGSEYLPVPIAWIRLLGPLHEVILYSC